MKDKKNLVSLKLKKAKIIYDQESHEFYIIGKNSSLPEGQQEIRLSISDDEQTEQLLQNIVLNSDMFDFEKKSDPVVEEIDDIHTSTLLITGKPGYGRTFINDSAMDAAHLFIKERITETINHYSAVNPDHNGDMKVLGLGVPSEELDKLFPNPEHEKLAIHGFSATLHELTNAKDIMDSRKDDMKEQGVTSYRDLKPAVDPILIVTNENISTMVIGGKLSNYCLDILEEIDVLGKNTGVVFLQQEDDNLFLKEEYNNSGLDTVTHGAYTDPKEDGIYDFKFSNGNIFFALESWFEKYPTNPR